MMHDFDCRYSLNDDVDHDFHGHDFLLDDGFNNSHVD
jgi:hypothetical protein